MTFITRLFPSFDSTLTLKEKSLSRELDLVARARADGTRNHPETAADEPTELELKIVTRGQHAIDETAQWLKKRLAETARAVRNLMPTPDERDIDAQIGEAAFALAKLRDENRDSLTALAERDATTLMELRKFKRDNNLTRGAFYAQSAVLVYGIGAVLLIAESVLNAQSFADVSDYGLVGGWLSAIVYSIGNFFLGFLLTGLLGLRYCLHISLSKRVLGILVTLLGAGTILGYNAYLGTVRAIIANDPDGSAYGQAFTRLIEDPTGFMNVPAAGQLFFIGLAFAFFFAAKGYGAFDTYPGYRKVSLRHAEARGALETGKIGFRNAAEAAVNTRIATIGKNLDAVETRNRKALDLINAAEIDATVAESAAVDSAAVCQRLIATWRAENAAIRTAPAPAYFRQLPSLDGELRGLPKTDFNRHRAERTQDIAILRTQAKAAQETLRSMALKALDTVTGETEHAVIKGQQRADEEGRATKSGTLIRLHAAQ